MSISEKIISWSSMNSDLLFLLGSLSIFILIISVFMMVLIISFLPEDYFKSENRNLISSVQNSRYPLLKLLVLIPTVDRNIKIAIKMVIIDIIIIAVILRI